MKYQGNRLKGIIIEIRKEVSGKSGHSDWRFRDIVIQHDQKISKHACITFGSAVIDQLQNYKIGDSVQVNFRIESKKNNDRWFNNLKAISIKMIEAVEEDVTNSMVGW